ncbi:MAG: ABC transporter substrate-binding protein [Sphingomonadales bacterium]|nr:MAG: ABC transporter substrate-binding protein [Sphingomonadales bacterium]
MARPPGVGMRGQCPYTLGDLLPRHQPDSPMRRLLLPIALCAALSGCGETGQRKDDAPVVVSAIGGPIREGDAAASPLAIPARILVGATAQGLVRFDAAGQIEPGLAERWIVIDDGLSFIFRLREAQWSDGTPVTAAQAVRALRKSVADPRSPLAPFLAVVSEIVEMTPQVIEVRLKRPRPDLLRLFAQPELAIARGSQGSGPFRIARATANGVALVPAPDPAAREGDPAPEETLLLRGERAAVALARFKESKSDLVLGGSFADWPLVGVAGIAPANVRIDPALGLFGLAVMHRDGFLAVAENRAALAMSIDRVALTKTVAPDWAPVETLLPAQLDSAARPTQPGWSALRLEARRLSATARVSAWRRTHPEPLTVRIALPSGPGATLVWAHLAASLRAIGVDPVRVGMDDRAELRLIDAVAPYDSGRWFVATACPACPEPALAVIDAGREAPDLAQRALRIAEADAALTADAAYIPLAQPFRWSIVALRLPAWQGNARAWHPLNHLRNEAR